MYRALLLTCLLPAACALKAGKLGEDPLTTEKVEVATDKYGQPYVNPFGTFTQKAVLSNGEKFVPDGRGDQEPDYVHVIIHECKWFKEEFEPCEKLTIPAGYYVHKARWGQKEIWIDVKERLNDLLRQGKTSFNARGEYMNADPVPRVWKQLEVDLVKVKSPNKHSPLGDYNCEAALMLYPDCGHTCEPDLLCEVTDLTVTDVSRQADPYERLCQEKYRAAATCIYSAESCSPLTRFTTATLKMAMNMSAFEEACAALDQKAADAAKAVEDAAAKAEAAVVNKETHANACNSTRVDDLDHRECESWCEAAKADDHCTFCKCRNCFGQSGSPNCAKYPLMSPSKD